MNGTGVAASKARLGYRRAERGEWRRCLRCRELMRVSLEGIGGVSLGMSLRCAPIGTGASRKYGIREDHVCDRFEERGE